jgi:predicted O-methyltransferase YrrM
VTERLTEISEAPLARGAIAGAALIAAGSAMRRSREGALAGVAAGIAVRTTRDRAAALERTVRNSEDATAIAPRLGPHLSALGNWAVDADFARLVLAEMNPKPELVVELGSGLLTLLVALILEERGSGRLISVDHDPSFAAETAERLEHCGGRVELLVAPLRSQSFGGTEVHWYERSTVVDALPGPIDLLVVDGPPSTTTWTRWPAIEALSPHLAPNAVVLLDDGRRRHERATALRWAREHPELKLCWLDTMKGAWRLERHTPSAEPASLRAARRVFRTVNPNPIGFGRWPVRR